MNPALPASSRFLSLEQYVAQFDQNAIEWFFAHGIYIVLTVIIAIILLSLIDLMSSNIAKLLPAPTHLVTKAAQTQRRDTLTRIFASVLRSLVWIVTIVISFSELGFNITPFLAAAGAAGIAVGFGGQYLARDLITGFFVTLENQYRLGDYVCFEKTCGYVESINLRMTVLRDFDGTVYNVPHGTITRTANYSKGGGRIFLDFVVSYDNDMQTVIDMINRIGKEVAEDPHFKKMIATAPYFLRVEQFTDQGMVMKIAGSTGSGKQWEISGELRKRLKLAADAEGINLPRSAGYYSITPPQWAPAAAHYAGNTSSESEVIESKKAQDETSSETPSHTQKKNGSPKKDSSSSTTLS